MNDTLATTYELNELAAKLHRQEPLGQREIDVLEKAVEALGSSSPVSSEIASISNNIWCLIQQLPVQTFWITISSILTTAKINHTKSLSLNSISRRIAFDWPHLDQHQKVNITEYIFSLQNEAIDRGNEFGMVGEVIIALLRLEWGGLLSGFISRMTDNLKTMPAKNILYNFQLLKRLLRQSFDTWTNDFTTQEYQHFRNGVESQLRSVMQLACFCLSQTSQPDILIPACLKFLLEIIDIVPVFEIFNCQLLQLLLRLLKSKDFGRLSMKCLKEIFSFKEMGVTQEHHSKIARRLFSILEKEIGENNPTKRTVTNFDKQSTSTADSLGSKVTVSLNKTKEKNISPDLVDLLYLYLLRYVPSMDSRPDQKYFEIQFSSSSKLLFSKELYDYFEKGFWKFVSFLIEFGRKSDQKLSVLSDQQQQLQFKYLVCTKLILVLFGKLGLAYEDILQDLIQLYILRLAPLQKAFRKYYILFDLIMDQTNVYIELDQVHNFSEEYCQNYIQGMELIFKNRALSQIYSAVLQKLLDRVLQAESQIINPLKKKMRTDLSYKVNLVNRISWSLMHGFKAGGQGFQQISINRIVGGFIQQTIEAKDVIMKKCYSLNSKYILQAFKGTQFAHIIFSSFLSNSPDIVYQFNIILISNIFLHPTFAFKDLGNQWVRGVQNLLHRVQQIKAIGTYSDEFNRIYPAMFRLGMKVLHYGMEHEQDLTSLIKEWLDILIYDELNALLRATVPQNLLDIRSLKKINRFLANLEDIAALLLQECETRQKGTYWMLKQYLIELKELIKVMGFKYKLYSDYVYGQTYENFEVAQIIEFRQRYNFFVSNTIKLFSLRTKIQLKDDHITPERKAKLIKERSEIVQATQQRLFEDFQAQIQFKCCYYLNVALEYYKYLVNQKRPNYSQIINKSIKAITAALNQERVHNVERLTTAKLHFWKAVIQNFMNELKTENIDEFCNIYTKFAQYTATNAQTCLQMVERVLEKLDSQFKDGQTPLIWSHFAVIFRITFERLFDEVCKSEEIFKRVAHILYFSVAVADGTERKLAGPTQGKKSNVEVLFLFIREHVSSTLGDCGEQQDLMLQNLFKERNQDRFISKTKDYKVGLMRWLKHNSNQA